MLNKYINHLLTHGNTLSVEDSYAAANALFSADDLIAIASFLSILHTQGESVANLLGFHRALVESGRSLIVEQAFVDIVGTGGDKAGTLNISTGGALLTAACGVPVIKHGNRAVSSKCGSADVIAELGFKLNLSDSQLAEELEKNNFAFCFAPNYYPVLAKVATVRKQLAHPTIFNLLGPLLNPAGREHILLGVYKAEYVSILAEALFQLGTINSLVFHANGLDELSCLGAIKAKNVTTHGISDFSIDPIALGLKLVTIDQLTGADRMYNAQMLQRALNGQPTGVSSSLALNAGVALYLYGKVHSVQDGVSFALKRLSQGSIIKLNKLQQIVARKYHEPIKCKSLSKALSAKPFAVIAEIKRASPSVGVIAPITDPVARALEYVSLGACAISVLTDAGFNGTMADLNAVSAGLVNSQVPILCKDFFLTPPQIVEAATNGADAILLMVHLLKDKTKDMIDFAHAFGLEVLVEVHTLAELEFALSLNADVIGVNQRDLNDFSMHAERFAQLIGLIPEKQVKIAESGLKTREQALAMFELGYDGVLVGEALSRLDNPADFFGDMRC